MRLDLRPYTKEGIEAAEAAAAAAAAAAAEADDGDGADHDDGGAAANGGGGGGRGRGRGRADGGASAGEASHDDDECACRPRACSCTRASRRAAYYSFVKERDGDGSSWCAARARGVLCSAVLVRSPVSRRSPLARCCRRF